MKFFDIVVLIFMNAVVQFPGGIKLLLFVFERSTDLVSFHVRDSVERIQVKIRLAGKILGFDIRFIDERDIVSI